MGIEEDIVFLRRNPALGVLGDAALRIIAIGAESRYVRDGEVLFNAGEPADAGYVVQEGAIQLTPSNGGEASTFGPGTLIGEFALLTATKRPATATAVEPSTVMRISRSLFLKMLEGYPDAAVMLRNAMAARANESLRAIDAVREVIDPHAPRR